jgi:hypothetical protein
MLILEEARKAVVRRAARTREGALGRTAVNRGTSA